MSKMIIIAFSSFVKIFIFPTFDYWIINDTPSGSYLASNECIDQWFIAKIENKEERLFKEILKIYKSMFYIKRDKVSNIT